MMTYNLFSPRRSFYKRITSLYIYHKKIPKTNWYSLFWYLFKMVIGLFTFCNHTFNVFINCFFVFTILFLTFFVFSFFFLCFFYHSSSLISWHGYNTINITNNNIAWLNSCASTRNRNICSTRSIFTTRCDSASFRKNREV